MALLKAGPKNSLLSEILAYADTLNHSIPNSTELSSALSKLASVGVIEQLNSRYSIADDYIEQLEKAFNQKGGVFKSGSKGHKWLESTNFQKANNIEIIITGNELKTAYEKYVSKF